MVMQARLNGEIIAESDDTVVVEGNHYFPLADVDQSKLIATDTATLCPWKGTASYFSVHAGGQTAHDAAWYYASPKPEAAQIENRVAFWKGVEVVEV